jgi:hypothetical protein
MRRSSISVSGARRLHAPSRSMIALCQSCMASLRALTPEMVIGEVFPLGTHSNRSETQCNERAKPPKTHLTPSTSSRPCDPTPKNPPSLFGGSASLLLSVNGRFGLALCRCLPSSGDEPARVPLSRRRPVAFLGWGVVWAGAGSKVCEWSLPARGGGCLSGVCVDGGRAGMGAREGGAPERASEPRLSSLTVGADSVEGVRPR